MSKMLEQAIIDAEALKEAALKTAEQNIIEKYSVEVKEAVNHILEQPEDLGVEIPMDPAPEGEMGATDEFPDMPRADTDGDDLCACPEEGEEITIDLTALAAELEREMEDEKIPHEDLLDLDVEEDGEEEEELELTEDVEIPDEFIDQLMEKLSINVHPVPSGVPGGGSNITNERELEDIIKARMGVDNYNENETTEDDAQLAVADATTSERDLVKISSTEEIELNEKIETLTTQRSQLVKQNNELKSLLSKVKVKLEEVNLSNAQLYYTNQVLGSTSLNGRQKSQIVESLSNTSTVEETKVIFETLQSAVGQDAKSVPKSLSEVVKRNSAVIPRREEKIVKDPVSNRWKTLAGITKKR